MIDKAFGRLLAERLLLVVLAAGLVFAAVTCAPAPTPTPTPKPVAPTPTPPPPEVLKVGVMAPYTGPAARTGEEFKNAITMAFDAIDYKIGNYKVELVWIDSESDPEKATRAYEEAVIRDKIQAGLANWHSSVSVACMEVAAKHKIPHFFAFGATNVVNEKYESDPEKYSYWMGKWWPVPEKLSTGYVIALEEATEAGRWAPEKKAAVVNEDTDWGRSFGEAIRGQLEEAGWEVLAEEYIAIEETEFYPLLTKLKDLDVDLVAGAICFPAAFSSFIKQARDIGLESMFVVDGIGYGVGEWYELAGDASDYVLDMQTKFATDEAKAFAEEFEKKWGIKPAPSSAGLAYDAANFFIKVCQATLEEYGELTSETLYKFGREKVYTGEFTYTDGILMEEYKYTPETFPDAVVGKGYYIFPIVQYFGGEAHIVWPFEWKEIDLEIPSELR
jgi:branched-chain amino acid transport system substrate-binding protein